MSFLCEYISNIAIFLVFAVFAEIILPDSKYRGYINLIAGFILIMILLKPVGKLFTQSENFFESFVMNIDNELSHKIIENEETFYTDKQREIIKEKYCEELKQQAAQILGGYCTVEDVNFVFDKESLRIQNAEFVIFVHEKEKSFFRIERREDLENEQAEYIKNIKNIISNFYNLSFDNINIIVRKK